MKMALRSVRNVEQAEELVQDFLLNVWKNQEELETDENGLSYICIRFEWLLKNQFEKRNKRSIKVVDVADLVYDDAEEPLAHLGPKTEINEELLNNQRLIIQFAKRAALSKTQVRTLYYMVQDMRPVEMASAEGLTVRRIETRIAQMKKKLALFKQGSIIKERKFKVKH